MDSKPPPLPLNLVLALPRPKMLKRLLIDAASLGIKRIVLINAWKVDKSYWRTPNLKAGLLREKLLLGLEQAGDTVLPELIQAPRFRPFVEDDLDGWAGPGRVTSPTPATTPPCPTSRPGRPPWRSGRKGLDTVRGGVAAGTRLPGTPLRHPHSAGGNGAAGVGGGFDAVAVGRHDRD